jgi:hypothetical protein
MEMASEGTGSPPSLDPSVIAKLQTGVDGYAPLNLPADMTVAGQTSHGLTYDGEAAQRTARLVGWRIATNAATILCILGLIYIAITPLWHAHLAPPEPEWLTRVKALAGETVPGWAARMWQGLQAHWQTTLTLVGLIGAIHIVNRQLAAAIRDGARGIWRFPPAPAYVQPPIPGRTDSHDPSPHSPDHSH